LIIRLRLHVTTVTVPTPIQPTPTCLRHSRAIRTIPEPLCQSRTPSSLTRSSSRLINASRTLWPHPEPVRVLATHPEPSGFIPSQLASHQRTPEPSDPLASRQRIPDTYTHSRPDAPLSFFLLLRQVYSRRSIGLATAVGRSPIAYLPRPFRLSMFFLALYISVLPPVRCTFPMSHRSLPFARSSVSSSALRLRLPLVHISLFLSPSTLLSYFVLSLRPIPDRSRSSRSLPHPALV